MITVKSIKESILHYSNTNPISNKSISRAWAEGFASGVYTASDEVTGVMFDEVIDWIRQQYDK